MTETTLEKIYRASLKLLEPLSPEETYTIIVEEAKKLVNADYGSIFLMRDRELKRVYASSPVFSPIKIRKKGLTYQTFKRRQAHIVAIKNVEKIHPLLKKIGVKSIIFTPLSYRNKSIGVLIAQSSKREIFSEEELTILKLFGSIASLAIRKIELHDETEKALETRDRFISMAAHELRTPITTIYGYSQLLYNRSRSNKKNKQSFSTNKQSFSTNKQSLISRRLENKQSLILAGARIKQSFSTNEIEARWISSLHAESYRLTLLINDLLEINRIRSGKLQYILKECCMREVIKRAVNNFRFNHPDRQIIFEDDLEKKGEIIIGDFDRLMQVVINLLDNAAKFSPLETTITISLKLDGPNLILRIKDQGRGIPKKDLPRVFEDFYKGSEEYQKGLGLGLFLVKNIIDWHHGSIHIHSKLNKGTLIEVRLPKIKV